MGVNSKKAPPLPAPTETETTGASEISGTELSRPADEKSSYSIPEDGTPVTIPTRGHRANKSQTSLLIEYFEGSKNNNGEAASGRRPSVRVRFAKKGKGDHIQLTETKGSRKASLTKRIPLDDSIAPRDLDLGDGEELSSLGSYASATEESNVSRNPVDIEIDRGHRRRRPASPLIPSGLSAVNASEISAIPADSFLDGSGPGTDLKSYRTEPLVADAASASAAAATSAMDDITNTKSRNNGKERIKATDRAKDRPERKRRPKSRATSVSEPAEDVKTPRRRSGKHDSTLSAADSSVLSSNVTGSYRSGESQSVRSGASRSSINNPKLLETVEDAIRRLILPELTALKREQSKRETRRGSVTSTATSGSRDELGGERRRSSGKGDHLRESPKHRERRNREARHDYDGESFRSPSYDSLDAEYREQDYDPAAPRQSSHGLLKAAAAGAAGAAVMKGLASSVDSEGLQNEDRRQRERRRRRAESSRSRSLGREKYVEEYDDEPAPTPPMPLMSEINASDLTRTSILSAESERPHSATEEFATMRQTPHEGHSAVSTPAPAEAQNAFEMLGAKHANISHGDLTDLPRGEKKLAEEYETDEFGDRAPVPRYNEFEDDEARDLSDPDDYPEEGYDNSYFSTQAVPPPLKYVPYQAGARGLSPIPSVSGYTDADDAQPRNSRNLYSPSSELRQTRSAHSMASIPSNMRSREFDRFSPERHRTPSDENRRPQVEEQSPERIPTGQTVKGVGANPDFVHTPVGVESAVASLVDGSLIEPSVLTGGPGEEYGAQRESTQSYDTRSVGYSSRGDSPDKMSLDSPYEHDRQVGGTPGATSHDHSQGFSEYELDEHGRKIPRTKQRESPTASEAAITAGAVGAAAAALKAAQERKQTTAQGEWEPAGVNRNKSFKERTMEGQEPRNTPAHSVDRFEYDDLPKMGVSGLPDARDPMPEIGYMDDDQHTNPSIVRERLDGDEAQWHGRITPTQGDYKGKGVASEGHATPTNERSGLGLAEAAGVAALGAAAGMAAAHSRELSQDMDEWQRTSEDRKRDTLVTNPYEDTSPVANPALGETLLGTRGLSDGYNAAFHTGSPGYGPKYDEGYMSNGPIRTPENTTGAKALGLPGLDGGNDPFYVPAQTRKLSGMSHGMASPFFDASTGAGIERIENKDIVALMQHLMVRDAQRSARDTEIVALLMNAALEMRTSFQEMKDFIQDTGDDVIFANVENTEKLEKAINGPRPFPANAARSIQSGQSQTFEESAQKKKNLWKRALQGLSAKGTTDLTRIEDMLMQLLGEVDALRHHTAPNAAAGVADSSRSPDSVDQGGRGSREGDEGPQSYSTSAYGEQSAPSLAPQSQPTGSRPLSDKRVSTVAEEDEYEYDHPSPANERTGAHFLNPKEPENRRMVRGSSAPLEDTPQAFSQPAQQPLSAEATPHTEKGKKHKSTSSSGWLPKISRWSETTASSVGKAFRTSDKSKKEPKFDDYLPPSRSGSSLASYDAGYQHDTYDDHLHTGFSDPSLARPAQQAGPTTSQPPQMTSHLSPEDPKYKAHRNSLNLQHPQPRPGQTERFHNALEHSAQDYYDPTTPRSADWAGSATSLNRLPQNQQRYSNSSALREEGYWSSPNQNIGPPRPPKEALDSYATQTPPRSNRLTNLVDTSSPQGGKSYDSAYGTMSGGQPSRYAGSPKLENKNLSGAYGGVIRKPTGPRAMTPKSPEEEAARDERRRKRDTFGSIASQDTDTF